MHRYTSKCFTSIYSAVSFNVHVSTYGIHVSIEEAAVSADTATEHQRGQDTVESP